MSLFSTTTNSSKRPPRVRLSFVLGFNVKMVYRVCRVGVGLSVVSSVLQRLKPSKHRPPVSLSLFSFILVLLWVCEGLGQKATATPGMGWVWWLGGWVGGAEGRTCVSLSSRGTKAVPAVTALGFELDIYKQR